jgi:hypothetical protein
MYTDFTALILAYVARRPRFGYGQQPMHVS